MQLDALSPSVSKLSSPTTRPYEPREKKPRIRHTEAQLIALNDLYDENEHPSLEERASLAEQLGMEARAVNAWFANKRSATKKKSKGFSNSQDSPPPSSHYEQQAHNNDDEEDWRQQPSWSTPEPSEQATTATSEPPVDMSQSEHKVFDRDMMGSIRKMRVRPTTEQTEALRQLYAINSHPSREEREELGDRIGMRYQSVTNWFQNQRSFAKRRKEEETVVSNYSSPLPIRADSIEHLPQSSLPGTIHLTPLSHHSSFGPSPTHSDDLFLEDHHQHHHISGHHDEHIDQKPLNLRRLGVAPIPRPRRTRPEPYQLEALRKLFSQTANPSIEERGGLAQEIGMDIGKVTNWFRNLRQTARKRAAEKIITGDEGDDDGMGYDSLPISRACTPSPPSSSTSVSSSVNGDAYDDGMDLDGHDDERGQSTGSRSQQSHSDGGSDDDLQEALTPSPSLPHAHLPHNKVTSRRMQLDFLTGSPAQASFEDSKAASRASVEDALLLLGFSKHVTR